MLCVGKHGEMIQAAVGDGSAWGAQVEYAFDGPRLLGTGGALRQAIDRLGEAFLVMYGDSYLRCDFPAVERAFLESGLPGLMTVFRNDGRFDRSNVLFRPAASSVTISGGRRPKCGTSTTAWARLRREALTVLPGRLGLRSGRRVRRPGRGGPVGRLRGRPSGSSRSARPPDLEQETQTKFLRR